MGGLDDRPYLSLLPVNSTEAPRSSKPKVREIHELAQSYLNRADEDWTWCDPEDVKRLARFVVELGR